MDAILFHSSCFDGYAAAYVAKLRYPEAKMVPLDHGLPEATVNDIIFQCTDKDVLMLDFSFRTREQNDRLAATAKSFHIYDHHKTAQSVLDGAKYATFDTNRSGAGLTWDFLFGKDSREASFDGDFEDRPWYIDFVEDRDLWRFKLHESKSINAFIMTTPFELEAWRLMTEVSLTEAITKGKAVELEINKYIREVVKQVQPGTLSVGGVQGRDFTVGVFNAPYLHTSDIGNAVAHRYEVGLGWFERHDSMIQFSARSIEKHVDVSAIAQNFGGGGHFHASGWQLPINEGRQLIDRILGRVPPGPPKITLDNRGGIGHN